MEIQDRPPRRLCRTEFSGTIDLCRSGRATHREPLDAVLYKGVLDELIGLGYSHVASEVADRLVRLKTQLKNAVRIRNVADGVLIATWNIREFGRNQKAVIVWPHRLAVVGSKFRRSKWPGRGAADAAEGVPLV